MTDNGHTAGGRGDEKLLTEHDLQNGVEKSGDHTVSVTEPTQGSWGRAW